MWLSIFRRTPKAFDRIAGKDQLICRSKLKKALNTSNQLLVNRIFELIDLDKSGYIDRYEFDTFANTISYNDKRHRLRFIIAICDLNGDGYVNKDELGQILDACIRDQSLNLTGEQKKAIKDCVFSLAGLSDDDKGLNLKEFKKFIELVPGFDFQFDQFVNELLGRKNIRQRSSSKSPVFFKLNFFRNYLKDVLWFSFYAAINVFLFFNAMSHYELQGATLPVQLARGGGACLNFNCALILLPMCKVLLGRLRHSALSFVLPLDNLTEIHKGIAFNIIGFSFIHIAAHFTNYTLNQQNIALVLCASAIGITGVGITSSLLLISVTGYLRSKNYERFLSVHKLYVLFFILTLLHGPVFWLWLLPTGLLFLVDIGIRIWRKRRTLKVSKLESLPDGVTLVRFCEHPFKNFYPGDYLKIRIPSVAKDEWHPFTISAAPESFVLDLHIRYNGDWTGALHNLSNRMRYSHESVYAQLDGPYSAPTSSVYRSDVVVLIAGGIGVTPFASTLQSLLLNEKNNTSVNQQVYFHWLNRSQNSYSWFIDLLNQASKQLGSDRFHLHIHLTSLTRSFSNIVMQMAFDAFWSAFRFDPITGLPAQTSAGRPNWDLVFSELAAKYPNKKVDVYFCGPKRLGKSVRKTALKYGLYFREEKFE
ncbi:ferric reductase-like transmembrane domain-containing protein [Reinekea marinisedimentorum]|uniref:Putative ferric reductase n=1 Tax=Reinekea marinisedimentorum TaxID=230495 RepID=A0A4R3IBM9_9GAMM|nr:ferric reductase-like transmembrane domain-containing protein [Reinekea marinisedimentorum]TCS43015.1 putative ferric reductase [Reinekea marinisedimentorum]